MGNYIKPLGWEIEVSNGEVYPVNEKHHGSTCITCEGTKKNPGCNETKPYYEFYGSLLKQENPRCITCLKKAEEKRKQAQAREIKKQENKKQDTRAYIELEKAAAMDEIERLKSQVLTLQAKVETYNQILKVM